MTIQLDKPDPSEQPGFEPTDVPTVAVVVPCFNEASNLPVFYERLKAAAESASYTWQLILVDDHSVDDTFGVGRQLAEGDDRVLVIRLAKNVGSHAAAACGLNYCDASSAAVMAADLQDPPEMLGELLDRWRNGTQVVWAVRASHEDSPPTGRFFSFLYNFMMMHILNRPDITAQGADFFLIDRVVIGALRQFRESNSSLVALLQWIGFRQDKVEYEKDRRLYGESGWSIQKKLKLVLDSVTAFSFAPIRFMSGLGILVALLGLIYAMIVVANALLGTPVQGWSSLMVVVLILGGLQIIMLGILGEYLWRSLDETRRRPRYLVEEIVGKALEKNAPSASQDS